jgi:hypothetical protein
MYQINVNLSECEVRLLLDGLSMSVSKLTHLWGSVGKAEELSIECDLDRLSILNAYLILKLGEFEDKKAA